MQLSESTLVCVQGKWNDWRTALVRLGDLHAFHWKQPAGAPRPVVHAYIACTRVLTGRIQHECEARSAPHDVLVCILKSHTLPPAYERIARAADSAPAAARWTDGEAAGLGCAL